MGVKAAKAKAKRSSKAETSSADVDELESLWLVKQKDLTFKDKLSKQSLLETLIARGDGLSDEEVLLKKSLISHIITGCRPRLCSSESVSHVLSQKSVITCPSLVYSCCSGESVSVLSQESVINCPCLVFFYCSGESVSYGGCTVLKYSCFFRFYYDILACIACTLFHIFYIRSTCVFFYYHYSNTSQFSLHLDFQNITVTLINPLQNSYQNITKTLINPLITETLINPLQNSYQNITKTLINPLITETLINPLITKTLTKT